MIKKIEKIIVIFTLFSLLFVSFNILTYVDSIKKYEKVYVAIKDINEGSKLDEKNFSKYIGAIKIDPELSKSLKLISVSIDNQNIILKNRFKIARYKGDFITKESMKSSYNMPMKHLIGDLSSDIANSNLLVPVLIEIPSKDKAFSKGVKRGDRVQIWFINNSINKGKKCLSVIPRYKNVPIIDLDRKGDILDSITIVLPSQLAKTYEIESKLAKKIRIIFMPPNYSDLLDDNFSQISSLDIENEYAKGTFYDLEKDIEIENFKEGI